MDRFSRKSWVKDGWLLGSLAERQSIIRHGKIIKVTGDEWWMRWYENEKAAMVQRHGQNVRGLSPITSRGYGYNK